MFQQRLGPALHERHLAAVHPGNLGLVNVQQGDLCAGAIGEHDAQRQPDVSASADDHDRFDFVHPRSSLTTIARELMSANIQRESGYSTSSGPARAFRRTAALNDPMPSEVRI